MMILYPEIGQDNYKQINNRFKERRISMFNYNKVTFGEFISFVIRCLKTLIEDFVCESIALLQYPTGEKNWIGKKDQFRNIKAVGKNLYLCSYDDDSEFGVLLTEKGTEVGKH